MESPELLRVEADGIELCCFEWGRSLRGQGPTLLLVHATGFHARCWDPVVRRLGERHVVAVDQRGHGRSEKTVIRHWEVFGRDLAGLLRTLDLRDVVGVGHSMGGHALVEAAFLEPTRIRRAVLIDPVIAAPDDYGGGGWAIPGQSHPTARRKRSFASPEAMIERFRDRVPYRVFQPEALDAYCRFGLLPEPEGEGYVLACPPETEASIYMTSRTNAAVHDHVAALEIPVLVVRARLPPDDRDVMDFSSSPTWPGLADAFERGRDLHVAEHTHFVPLEIPDRVAEWIVAEVEAERAERKG